MMKKCDYTSVGVVVHDSAGRFALLRRAKFPIGIAPAAGHIDDHGSPEQAALAEVREELGLTLHELKKTAIYNRRVENRCRRPGGSYHIWYIYEATTSEIILRPDADETKGARWYDRTELQDLAERTRAYHAGKVGEADWAANPGLEEVWLPFMEELEYVTKEG